MIDLIIVATGWAIWDLFVFALPKDNGFWSLKTYGKFRSFKDFPHLWKKMILGMIIYRHVESWEMFVLCVIMALVIQRVFYTFLKKVLDK